MILTQIIGDARYAEYQRGHIYNSGQILDNGEWVNGSIRYIAYSDMEGKRSGTHIQFTSHRKFTINTSVDCSFGVLILNHAGLAFMSSVERDCHFDGEYIGILNRHYSTENTKSTDTSRLFLFRLTYDLCVTEAFEFSCSRFDKMRISPTHMLFDTYGDTRLYRRDDLESYKTYIGRGTIIDDWLILACKCDLMAINLTTNKIHHNSLLTYNPCWMATIDGQIVITQNDELHYYAFPLRVCNN